MAQRWNALCPSPISGILSNPEENVGNHVDNLIENNNLSSTLVSQEKSSACHLNPEQPHNYNSLQWNNEAAPSLLLDIQENLLGGKSHSVQDVVVDSNTQGTKRDLGLLSSSALEQYSDVSSCSGLDIDRTVSPCVEVHLDCHQTQEKENTLELVSKQLSFSSPQTIANSNNSMQYDCPIKDMKESIDYNLEECGRSTPENLSCCHEGSPLSTVWDRAKDFNKHIEDNLPDKDAFVSQEDQYSNISSPLEGVREQSPIREDEEMKDHSTAGTSDGSQQLSPLDCRDVVVQPHGWTSAFETNSIETVANTSDGDCKDTGGSRKEIVSSGSRKRSNNRSMTKLSQRLHLEMNDGGQFGTKPIAKDGIHEDRESDCHSPHNIEEERSSFDFLERCLGLRDFSRRKKSSCEKEITRPTDKEGATPEVLDQTDHENSIPQSGPPTLVPVDLETSLRDEVKGSYSASSDRGPPILSVVLSGAVTNLEDGNMSALDKMGKDVGIRKTNLVQLTSTQRLKQSLHPVVVLKDSTRGKGYHCAECPVIAQNLSGLFKHHHCVHLLHNLHICNTCECYFTDDELATQHKCTEEVDTAGICIQKVSLPITRSMCPQKSHQEGKRIGCNQHKCQYCHRTFQKRYEFYQHMRKHTGVTPFKCGKCGLYYSQSSSLNRHKRLNRCKRQGLKDPSGNKMIQKLTPSCPKDQNVQSDEVPSVIPLVKLIDCYVKLVDYRKEKQSAMQNCCETCGKCFRLRALLAAHRRSHTDERPFKCHNCLKAFKHPCNLNRHKKQHCPRTRNPATFKNPLKSLAGEYKCPICRSSFKYSYNRFRHIREVCLKEYSRQGKGKVGNVYKCALCKSTFANASNRSRHIKTSCLKEYIRREIQERRKISSMKGQQKPQLIMHPQQKNYLRHKCSFCPATFAHASGKYKHMRKHKTQEKTVKPLLYQASLPPLDQKIEDTDTVSNIEENVSPAPFSCRFCGKFFLELYTLKKHMRLHSGDRPYQCQQCSKRFFKRSHLDAHKNVHRRRIQCTVCKKILPTISELIKHRQTHNKKGMLQCPDCPLQFKYPAFLLRHLSTHKQTQQKVEKSPDQDSLQLEEKPQQENVESFRCSLCDGLFESSKDLSKHCLTHIPNHSINKCPICKRHFCSRNAIIRHMRLHTGEKPYHCLDCGKRFTRNETLKAHQKKCSETCGEPVFKSSADSPNVSEVREVKKIYNCKYCPQTFFWPCSLSKHHRKHMLKTIFPCSKCGRCFRKQRLLSHEKCCNLTIKNFDASPLQGSACRTCGQEFSQQYNRIIHEKKCKASSSVLPENLVKNGTANQTRGMDKLKHRCPHCPKAFRYRCYLLRHLVAHTRREPLECSRCGRKYTDRKRYLKHESSCEGVYRHSRSSKVDKRDHPLSVPMTTKLKSGPITKAEGEGEYKCRFCTKSFMKAKNLRRHILTHTEVKPYRCKTCESCFRRYDHLKLHQNRCKGKRRRLEVRILKLNLEDLRKDWQKKPSSAKAGEMAECSSCEKVFSSKINLARHVALCHTTVKPFSCKYCSTSFSQECTLKKHNLKCNGKTFFSSQLWRSQQEIKAHSPRERGPGKPCRETSKLLMRIQRHYTDKQKYVCAYCPRRFRNREQMIVHTRLHTGEKPFGCANCGEHFIRRDYLKRHLIKCKFGKESEESMLCEQCGGLFNADELQSHQKSCVVKRRTPDRNPKIPVSHSASPKKRGFSCANCDAQFILFSQLQQHFLMTHRADTYLLPQGSPSQFQQQLCSIGRVKEEPNDEGYEINELGEHNMRIEKVRKMENNKALLCPYCNLRFVSDSGLEMHLSTHVSNFKVFCKRCKRGFWTKATLQKHYRTCCVPVLTKEEPNIETLALTDMNPPVQNTVLVFNSGSKTTGTGVLQTKFSCKEGYRERLDSVEVREMTSPRSSKIIHKYQCSECDQSFTDGLLLMSHLENHGREELERKQGYRCNQCGKVFNQPGVLSRHLKIHKSMKTPYACPACPKTFRHPSDLNVHRHCHDPNRPFVCSLCQLRFWTNASLSIHTSAVHRPKKPIDTFACQFCTKSYSVKASYQKHCRMKHLKQWRKALMNGQTMGLVSSKPDLDIAVNAEGMSHESNDEDGDVDSDSAPYFPCHVCGKTFTTSESLEDHQRCHLGEKPHECAECGKCFFQLSNLQQHQRSHKSEFQCQTCGRGFVSLFALRKHKHSHGKNRPHHCSKCLLSFTGPTQLAEHIATHRNENFPCDLCDRTFTCKLSRAEHRKSHTEPEESLPALLPPQGSPSFSLADCSDQLKYRCGICCERFQDPEQLSEHGCFAARERPYSCTDCNQHFLCGAHLKKHQLSRHQLSQHISQSYLYQCNRCHMHFTSRHQFLNHLKKHGFEEAGVSTGSLSMKTISNGSGNNTENIYKCPICPHSFSHALELAEHLSVHGESTFKCRVCSETFASKSNLAQHEQCHQAVSTPYECTECGDRFLGSDAFHQHQCARKEHVARDHVQLVPSSSDSQKRLPSPAGVAVAQSINEELEVDVGEDFYKCPVCTKRFSSKPSLKEHLSHHTAYRPFKCLVCGKCFAQKRYLKKHQAIHQRTYRCDMCPQSFGNSKAHQIHRDLHNNQKSQNLSVTTQNSFPRSIKPVRGAVEEYGGDFRCDMCYKSFGQLSSLRRHQETHVGQIVYECTECDKVFAFFHLLEEHQNSHASSPLPSTPPPHALSNPISEQPSPQKLHGTNTSFPMPPVVD